MARTVSQLSTAALTSPGLPPMFAFDNQSSTTNLPLQVALQTTRRLFGNRIMTTLRPKVVATPWADASLAAVSDTHHNYGPSVVILMSIILVFAMIFAIVGNTMVILTIIKHKSMRTRTNMFIVNLAVADILVAVFDMPFSIVTLIRGDWVFGSAMCEFNGYTMAVFMIASVHTLMYISVHKYVSITRPFSRFMTPGRIALIISFTWIWSNAYAFGGAIGWNSSIFKKGATQCGPSYPDSPLKKSHSMVNTLFNLLVPFGVMSFCYYRIFSEIRRHMSRMRETTNVDARNSMTQQKRISTTLFVVLICFLLCWSPYIGYSTYAAFIKDKKKVPLLANPLAYWCGYINSACNPIIYAFRSPTFREGYYSVICGSRSDGEFTSRGSSSQRSPSCRKRSIPTTIETCDPSPKNTKPAAKTLLQQKRKRFVSMNSWASIIVPPSPIRKTANGSSSMPLAKRQLSRDKESSAFPLPMEGDTGTELDDSTSPQSPGDAHADMALLPISEDVVGSDNISDCGNDAAECSRV